MRTGYMYAYILVHCALLDIRAGLYSSNFTCMHSTREPYEKGANELHSEAALQDLNGQTDTGTNACINDKLRPTHNK